MTTKYKKNRMEALEKQNGSNTELIRLLSAKLTEWKKNSEIYAEAFEAQGMKEEAANSRGLAQAYWNIEQLIEVNTGR